AEGLGRDRGDGALGTTDVGVRAVEGFEKGIAQVATEEDIKAPAAAFLLGGRDGPDSSLAAQLGQLRGEFGEDGWASHRERKTARDGEQGVSDRLAIEALTVLSPEEIVLRVKGLGLRVESGRLPVGRAGEHQLVHRLQAPPSGNRLQGEPVEQL